MKVACTYWIYGLQEVTGQEVIQVVLLLEGLQEVISLIF